MASLPKSALLSHLARGDAGALARALTLIENRGPGWEKVLAEAARRAKPAARLGITGPPGAGKSTMVNRLLPLLAKDKGPIGVVAVDPSSQFTGGAVLGDRFRLDPGTGPEVFFRSVAHRGAEGGLALAVRGMVTLLEAAGKRWIVLESLGVGQSELDILGLVDTLVVVLVPESGDYIQALKAGIMEAGDILVVNKMDREGAEMMRDELLDVLSYSRSRRFPGWEPKVLMTNARTGKGMEELMGAVRAHRAFLSEGGRLQALRKQQALAAVRGLVQAGLAQALEGMDDRLQAAGDRVAAGKADPYSEARKMVKALLKGGRRT